MPEDAVQILAEAGHRVSTARLQGLGGKSDVEIAAACIEEGRVLITLDTDFANLRAYPPQDYPGIIILRLAYQAKPNVLSVTSRLLELLGRRSPAGHLWIVDEHRIRIRPGDES